MTLIASLLGLWALAICWVLLLLRSLSCAGYIFESQMVDALLSLFPQAPFRNVALQCLTEVRAPQDTAPRPQQLCSWVTLLVYAWAAC